MLNPKNVLVLGFEPELFPPHEAFVWAIHDNEIPAGMGSSEYYLLAKKMVEDSDVLVINIRDRKLTFDEAVLIHSAYTKSTPLLVVGMPRNDMFAGMITKQFNTIDELTSHLENFYIN